ncbi:9362_t:CDS:2, partial [Dentiscutata heterogama]
YNTWVWTTIKWKLPGQKCSDQVRVYWLIIPLNPTGWSDELDEPDESVENAEYPLLHIRNGLFFYLPILLLIIASSEILVQKNPIINISENFDLSEMFIVLFAIGDVLITFTNIFRAVTPEKQNSGLTQFKPTKLKRPIEGYPLNGGFPSSLTSGKSRKEGTVYGGCGEEKSFENGLNDLLYLLGSAAFIFDWRHMGENLQFRDDLMRVIRLNKI